VTHGEYYFEERRPKLEDALKKAVLRFGVPGRLYCDYVPRNIITVMFPTALCAGGPRTAMDSSNW